MRMSARHADSTCRADMQRSILDRQRSCVDMQATVHTQAWHADHAAEIPTKQICLQICVQGLHADLQANLLRVIARSRWLNSMNSVFFVDNCFSANFYVKSTLQNQLTTLFNSFTDVCRLLFAQIPDSFAINKICALIRIQSESLKVWIRVRFRVRSKDSIRIRIG